METPPIPFDLDAVTPRMLIDFREATGVSLMALVDEELELDLKAIPEEAIGGVVWLALRMGGQPEATYEEALDTPFTRIVPAEVSDPDPS